MRIRHVLLSALVLALVAFGAHEPERTSSETARQRARQEPDYLVEFYLQVQDIESINLVNGLYLSADQARELAALARKACESKQTLENCLREHREDFQELFAQIRAELLKDGQVSPQMLVTSPTQTESHAVVQQ